MDGFTAKIAGENSTWFAWLVDLEEVSSINVFPNRGSLVLSKHSFVGWSDGVAIYWFFSIKLKLNRVDVGDAATVEKSSIL